jgi:hypothetical protein
VVRYDGSVLKYASFEIVLDINFVSVLIFHTQTKILTKISKISCREHVKIIDSLLR